MDGGMGFDMGGTLEPFPEMDEDDPEPHALDLKRTKSTVIPVELADRRNHDALERAQVALKQQLADKKQDLEDRIYEQGIILRRATKRREEAGVALYGMQKALASLHLALHKDAKELTTAMESHSKIKEELQQTTRSHTHQSAEVAAMRETLTQTHMELDDILNTLKEVEKYNEEIKSEIKINKRVTYASEEMMVQTEKAKKEEDLDITLTQTRMKHQYEKQALLRAQLEVQERETKLANVALSEAGMEMESINAEKKQITIQWKSSLLVLSRCDEALQGIIDAIASQKEQERAVIVEKESYKKAVRKEQERVEKQQMLLRKIDREMKTAQKLLGATTAKRLAIHEAWQKLVKEVEKLEASQAAIRVDLVHLEKVLKLRDREFNTEQEGIYDLEHKILQDIIEHCITEKKAAANTLNMILEQRELVKKEDMRATEIEFKMAKIRVEALSVMAYNESVKLELKAVNDGVEEKLVEMGKIQQEIRQNHAEVEMKTKEIDRLNKQFFKLTANMVQGDQTPWDHIMTNIKYEINRKVISSGEKQKEWLVMQTALISLITKTNDLSETLQKMSTKTVMLTHRRTRAESQCDAITKHLGSLEKKIGLKRGVIVRLNDMIAKNAFLEELLQNESANLQANNYAHLKDLDRELLRLEEQLSEATKEKAYAHKHYDELDHHVMLWKYKISFELKTQATIDPNVGRAVIVSLKKQCDRLKLRHDLSALTRDRLCQSLENQIANRHTIDVKIKAMSSRKGFHGPATLEASLLKACVELKRATKEAETTTVRIEDKLDQLKENKKDLIGKVGHMDDTIQEAVKQQELLRLHLRDTGAKKSKVLIGTTLHQRMCRRYESVKNKKWSFRIKGGSLEDELQGSANKCHVLIRLLKLFIQQFPHIQPKLDLILTQMSLISGTTSSTSTFAARW